MKKILVTGSNGYIGNALVLALLNRKKEFTVRAAARRGSILNSKSFETVRLGSLEESPDYVDHAEQDSAERTTLPKTAVYARYTVHTYLSTY